MDPQRLRVVTVRSLEELSSHEPAWRRLHAEQLEPNVFTAPDLLLPLLRHCGDRLPWMLAFVYGDCPDGERMLACAPFGAPETLAGMPLRALPTLEHPYLLSATPLLHRQAAEPAASALVAWLDARERPWSLVRWSRVGLDSRAWRLIAAEADRRGRRWWLRRSYARPTLQRRDSIDDYFAELPSRRRGRLRWRLNKLAREGALETRLHRDLGDPGVLDRFLQLEASGWKGQAGTALACDGADEAFFRESARALAARRALWFVELLLDGRSISITANYLDGDTAFAFKSGFAPELESLSPGTVNSLEMTRLLHEDPELRWIDSCAEEGSHLESIWLDATGVGEVLVATGAFAGAVVSMLPHLRRTREIARGLFGRRGAAGAAAV